MRLFPLMFASALLAAAPARAEQCLIYPRCNAGNGTSSAASCLYSGVKDLSLNIKKNEACTYNFYFEAATTVKTMTISRRPQNGQAGRANRFEIAYQPKPGFAGNDQFSITIEATVGGREVTHVFEVSVSVTP